MANLVEVVPAQGRGQRRPQHTFQVRMWPWQIQPFMIAPVLPGETLSSALMQTRAVTAPLTNPLIGWWFEQYLFYCKHRDLPDQAHFQGMMLEYGYDLTSVQAATAKAAHYHAGGTVDWVDQCMRAVIPHWFREGDEAWNVATIDGMPAAKISQNSWVDSALLSDAFPMGDTIAGGATAQAADNIMRQWELLRQMQLTTMTYDEFLRTFGVRGNLSERDDKPELIRYVRDWTYPSNTINPTDGNPTSACSWVVAERADKKRFFAEPGFIFGVCVARPKVYLSKQKGVAASMLQDAMTWLPALLRDDPQSSLKEFAHDAGPLAGFSGANNDNYWVDVRDLFMYGDQFVNFALTDDQAGFVALPTATMQKRYPSLTDAQAMFYDGAGTLKPVAADGVVSLTISSAEHRDHT